MNGNIYCFFVLSLIKPGSQYDAGASVASRASICKLSSIGERRRALADAGVRKISIRALQAQRPSISLFESVM